MSVSFCSSMTIARPLGQPNATASGVSELIAEAALAPLPGLACASFAALDPIADGRRQWVVGQVAALQMQISRNQEVQRCYRERAAFRAREFWFEDQKLHVEIQAEKLVRNPGKTVALLRQTPAGCDWLIQRWGQLDPIDVSAWTAEQKTLATRLAGRTPEAGATLACSPAAEIAALRAHRTRVELADTLDRNLVLADLTDDLGPEFARLRRFEQALLTRLRYFLGLLATSAPDSVTPTDPPRPAPTPPAATKPTPQYETKPTPQYETKPTPQSETKLTPQYETKPTPSPMVTETVMSQPVARQDLADRQRRVDLKQARKRQRQARRRQG